VNEGEKENACKGLENVTEKSWGVIRRKATKETGVDMTT